MESFKSDNESFLHSQELDISLICTWSSFNLIPGVGWLCIFVCDDDGEINGAVVFRNELEVTPPGGTIGLNCITRDVFELSSCG